MKNIEVATPSTNLSNEMRAAKPTFNGQPCINDRINTVQQMYVGATQKMWTKWQHSQNSMSQVYGVWQHKLTHVLCTLCVHLIFPWWLSCSTTDTLLLQAMNGLVALKKPIALPMSVPLLPIYIHYHLRKAHGLLIHRGVHHGAVPSAFPSLDTRGHLCEHKP